MHTGMTLPLLLLAANTLEPWGGAVPSCCRVSYRHRRLLQRERGGETQGLSTPPPPPHLCGVCLASEQTLTALRHLLPVLGPCPPPPPPLPSPPVRTVPGQRWTLGSGRATGMGNLPPACLPTKQRTLTQPCVCCLLPAPSPPHLCGLCLASDGPLALDPRPSHRHGCLPPT